MAEKRTYRHGRVLFAYLRASTTGRMQAHPAIVLNANHKIIQPENFDPRRSGRDNVVHVIGVSTKYRTFGTPYVRLPFSPTGQVVTALRQDCGAMIGWYHRIVIPDDVIGFGGDVPPGTMSQINRAVREDLAKTIGSEMGSLRQVFEELFGADGS